MRRQSDLTDIYGVKQKKSNPLERNNDSAETGFRHSDSYHRFFRGYTEIRRVKPNGRIGVERYYTQPWIVNAASDRVYWLNRLMYVSLVLLSVTAYIWAMCLPLDSNRAWFVALPGVAAVLLLFLLGVVVLNYLVMRRKMTLWDFETSTKRLKTVSLLASGCMAATAAAKVGHMLGNGFAIDELKCIGVVLFAAACTVAIYGMERDVVYTTIPNDTVLPEGEAHEIW